MHQIDNNVIYDTAQTALSDAIAGVHSESAELVQQIRKSRLAKLTVANKMINIECDDLLMIASLVCDNPMISMINIIDDRYQWTKAQISHGIELPHVTPIKETLCSVLVEQTDTFIAVEDASVDKRLCDKPLVLDGTIKFYAGVQLLTPERYALGSLCVADPKAKQLREDQKKILEILGKLVTNRLLLLST